MFIVVIILLLLIVYANSGTRSGGPLIDTDRITFNPFLKPAECPVGCKKWKFPDDYLTPSTLMNKSSCGYKQDSFVFPCPSTCCDRVFSMPGGQ